MNDEHRPGLLLARRRPNPILDAFLDVVRKHRTIERGARSAPSNPERTRRG